MITACDFTFLMVETFEEVLVFKVVFSDKEGDGLAATDACVTVNENAFKVFGFKVLVKETDKRLGLCFGKYVGRFAAVRDVVNIIKEEPTNVSVSTIGDVVRAFFKGFETVLVIVDSDKERWFFRFIAFNKRFRDRLAGSIGIEMFVHRRPFFSGFRARRRTSQGRSRL